jgi:hypothetical protein
MAGPGCTAAPFRVPVRERSTVSIPVTRQPTMSRNIERHGPAANDTMRGARLVAILIVALVFLLVGNAFDIEITFYSCLGATALAILIAFCAEMARRKIFGK